ncbi:MAG: hypothetical protein DHS20C15_25040 [Planctomycetota bacterium]|nr:MAG: hypothetical protein DHS20C15_25040 [Planctomycetota bacterium]
MSRAVLLLLPILCALSSGCGDAPKPSPEFVLRPGDSLLHALPQMQLRENARTRLPPPMRASLDALMAARSVTLPPDAWNASGPLQLPAAFAGRLNLEDGAERWSCRPEIPLDLPLGMVWVEHDGFRLERVRRDAGDPQHRWTDRRKQLLFWWDAESARLLAFGSSAPLEVRYGFDSRPDGVGLRDFELDFVAEAAGAADPSASANTVNDTQPTANAAGTDDTQPTANAAGTGDTQSAANAAGTGDTQSAANSVGDNARDVLAHFASRELSGVTRPALAVMAPSTLQLRVDRLEARALELQLAVPALGLARSGPRLVSDSAASDGVTFAVELSALGASEPAQRVWSQHLLPGEHWVHAEVDLSEWVGRGCVLRLVTEAGPAGHVAFDYALWSGLRVRGGVQAAPARPHVIFIDADTLRADRLGLYGAEHDTSPQLDAWAAREAIVFEHARSAADWTLPSTASMLTGLDVGQHGVITHEDRLQAEHLTLAERFADAGYETWGRTDSGFVTPTYGFDKGFEVFDAGARDDDRPRDGSELLEGLAARRSERPVFVFFQTYEVHAPFEHDQRFVSTPLPADDLLREKPVTEEFVRDVVRRQGRPLDDAQRRYISEIYDAGVARLDAQLGRFLEGLPSALGEQPYLVLITSDHGEELFDRGELGHGHSLHRELLHVPLLLRLPAGPRGLRRDTPASGLDLVPTLLAAAGLPIPEALSGRVLSSDDAPALPLVAQHGEQGWALEWQGFKLLHGRIGQLRSAPERSALFDLRADPKELVDRAADDPRRHEALLEQLEAWRAAHAALLQGDLERVTLSAAEREALQELGYLDDG